MSALQVLNYNQSEVRMVIQDDGPWWVLADVCRVLDLSNPRVVANRLDDDERRKLELPRQGNTWCVNESGLYSVILRSDKPEAKSFKRWITHEVLPAIRRTGVYAPQDTTVQVLDRLAGCMESIAERFDSLEQRIEKIEHGTLNSPAVQAASEDSCTAMDSMEVARILGRQHNNILKSIRAAVEKARLEGIPVEAHFNLCYRLHWNKRRCPYYRMDETAISMFSQNLKDWTLAEKLRAVFKEQNR